MRYYLNVVFNNYANFNGRTSLKEFWMFFLFNLLFTIFSILLDNLLGTTFSRYTYWGYIYLVYGLAILIPNLAVAVRRLHDTGKSGFWVFISLIPIIGGFVLLFILFGNGDPNTNRYGTPPKELSKNNYQKYTQTNSNKNEKFNQQNVIIEEDYLGSNTGHAKPYFENGSPPQSQSYHESESSQFEDYSLSFSEIESIRIPNEIPKTLEFIPGNFEVSDGVNTVTKFQVAGYPTKYGNVVTIGREEIRGEKAYSHIQLLERTVSRKQAEIIERNGKLFIKNLSTQNFTQLNGIEIPINEEVELRGGDRIKMGELEISYEV